MSPAPAERPFVFRELRLPKIPPAYRNYEPRQTPTITMFATDIRTPTPAEPPPLRSYEQGNTNWNGPEPEKKAAHIVRAQRRSKEIAA